MDENRSRITLRSLVVGTFFAGLFAYLTAYFENRTLIILTATQISVLPYVLLMACVLVINPLARLLRAFRQFSIAEILIIFVMGAVSSGISTFGLASQFIPVLGNLFNRHWNTQQTRWDLYIEPFINEAFFLSEPGIQKAAIAHREALLTYEELNRALNAATAVRDAKAAVEDARRKVEEAKAAEGTEAERIIRINREEKAFRFAERAAANAASAWEGLGGKYDRNEVLEAYPARVKAAKADLETKEATLRDLEKKAFDKVDVFRRGLPKGMRAIPGIVWQPLQEDFSMYVSRIRRLRHGMKALGPLRDAHALAGKDVALSDPGIQQAAIAHREALLTHEELKRALNAATAVRHAKAAIEDARRKVEEAKAAEGTEAERIIGINREEKALRFAERAAADAAAAWEGLAGKYDMNEVLAAYPEKVKTAKADLETRDAALRELVKKAFESWRASLEQLLEAAAGALGPVGDPGKNQTWKDGLDKEYKELSGELEVKNVSLTDLRQQRRLAPAEKFDELDSRISKLSSEVTTLSEKLAAKKIQLERAQTELDMAKQVGETIADIQGIRKALAGGEALSASEAAARLSSAMARFPSFDGTLRRFTLGDIDWGQWVRPAMNWGLVLVLTYVILMTFNVLIFRQWAHNEKLIFPLAELPEVLCGQGEPNEGGVPPILKRGLFWAGVCVSGFFLGWNLFVKSDVVPGLTEISLYFKWDGYVQGTVFSGLIEQWFHVFFTMIGLSFLIPAKISFSLWLFYVLYLVQLQCMVWAGYGVSQRSFPCMWWYELNFKTAEGSGALMVFAAVILYKCRKTIFCFFSPGSVKDLEASERAELRISSFLFVSGSIGLVLFLWLGLGANLYYTLFTYLIVIVITIGLVRAVAEGGILGFQCWYSPFHFVHSVFGMNKTWTSPSLFGPLMIYYSLIFLDIKTFIAPAMANSIKIRDDLKASRRRFHLAVFLGIAAAVVVSIVAHIILAYSRGADGMQGWFYTSFPQGLFGKIVAITKSKPVDTAAGDFWIGAGAVLMALLLYFRQFVFWLPHPIGMVMLVNPIMQTYWFSIFLGWLFKSLVTKYGNKDTYRNMRCMFIGLIAGELIVIVLAMIVTLATGQRIGIDLNRN
jgi:hypothetical protein